MVNAFSVSLSHTGQKFLWDWKHELYPSLVVCWRNWAYYEETVKALVTHPCTTVLKISLLMLVPHNIPTNVSVTQLCDHLPAREEQSS